jgi:hypothetical protein
MNKYYLYSHYRQDKSEIFYIGIGTKNKQDIKYNSYTRANNKTKRTNYWKNIITLNPDYIINIIVESNDYEFIKDEEVKLIKEYGRKDLKLGSLVNMTDGGEGQINRKWSIESKLKSSKSHFGKKLSKSHIENLKKHLYGNKSHTGRKFSTEHRDNISKGLQGRDAWNKDLKLSIEHITSIKEGIKKNKKICEHCYKEFDCANYTKWHGDKCKLKIIL